MKLNLKIKLILNFTLLVILTGAITALVGTVMINRGILNEVQGKVYTDLNSAREIFNNRLKDIAGIIEFTSIRDAIKISLINNDKPALMNYLQEARELAQIEILNIADSRGNVILRAGNPDVSGDDQSEDQLIKRVLAERKVISSPVIVSAEDLKKEGPELEERAKIRIISPGSVNEEGSGIETAGMMLKAAAPIFGDDGSLIGIVYGGDLINRNYSIVDKIKDTVYQGEVYKNKDMGAATIFMKDIRISTNIMTGEGRRAIGTRVSRAVYDRVMVKGKQYLDRAMVVDSWYITAYEPIRDIDDHIIGMLYVGMLEDKFVDFKWRLLWIFFGVTFLGMLLVVVISNFFANRITRPIKYLAAISKQISDGDFSVRADITAKDEIGELVTAFNSMARGLSERDEKLKDETQRQLMRSEKLAALGRMAAGVAHEINNPLTGILMYAHFLLKRFPEDSQDREDAKIIVDETTRCRELIRNLLDFSRENPPCKGLKQINEVIEDTINIIKNQIYFKGVKIVRNLSDNLPELMIDENQIKQVLINLMLNAAEAIHDGGNITIAASHEAPGNSIIVTVSDTGSGIPSEIIDKIFDPFFTTKEVGKGTGLGLAVSYGIIKSHGGAINVQSREGKGTCFSIILPLLHEEKGAKDNTETEKASL